MCTTCGCGEKHSHTHTHRDENGNLVTHTHEDHVHEHETSPQHTHDSAMGAERAISIEEDILARNNEIANENRQLFRQKHRVQAHQINTGKGCHLDAEMVCHAISHMDLADSSVLFIENVGNLVCPAEFDLGEAHKVVILSVTEGEDKPLKYPDMFRAADVMIINKIDLLPYVKFDIDACEEYARRVNPKIQVLRVSATTSEGLDRWITWLQARKTLAAF